jgi:hypothetical protein
MMAVRARDPNRAFARWFTSVSTRGEIMTVPASCRTAWHAADSRALRSDVVAHNPATAAAVRTHVNGTLDLALDNTVWLVNTNG